MKFNEIFILEVRHVGTPPRVRFVRGTLLCERQNHCRIVFVNKIARFFEKLTKLEVDRTLYLKN